MTVKINLNPAGWKEDLIKGLKASISDRKRLIATLAAGFMVFLTVVFSANPGYSVQMIMAGTEFWSIAFTTRITGLIMNTGYTGLLLTVIFSLLVGVTLTNTLIQLRMNRISTDAIGALPGLLAGGCASCGVGVLSMLGLGGILASMPFQGNILRLGGVILLTLLIANTGNPETCKI